MGVMSNSVPPVGVPTPSGMFYGPTATRRKSYLCSSHHRGARRGRDKHEWDRGNVPPAVEYQLFCTSDSNDWFDSNGYYWGFGHREGRMILGTQKERLCMFQPPVNLTDPWHGYPVSPLLNGDDDAPPDDFVQGWIDNNVISRTFGRRIQRGKV